MKISTTPLAGILVIEPSIFQDQRGYFFETYQQERYAEHGIPAFVQDNSSHSKRDVVRGLHYQLPQAQGKLIWITRGEVWDVMVDIRISSPTFGQWFALTLSEHNHTQVYIPPGFAHGFCVLSNEADFHYKCTSYYQPGTEHGIAWNDPTINIPWPVQTPVLSPKDTQYPALHEIPHDKLFA